MSPMVEDGRELTYGQAIFEAIRQEMERDPGVFVLGQGVDDTKGMYGTTKDLHVQFGPNRNFDTPLAEDAMTGVAIGAALAGMRPIHVHQRMDFLLLCMNQLINIAAKSAYMFNGRVRVPLVVRGIIGRSWGQGAQHSQAFHSYFMHVPGIKIMAPVTPHDAKGCMIAAIRDDNPTIIMEHRMLYGLKGIVPEAAYEVSFGQARTLGLGSDVTIVGISHMVVECMRARSLLADDGISAEVIDPVSLSPLDIETIAASVLKTGRLLVVDHGWLAAGASAEIGVAVMERLQGQRSFQFRRVGYAPSPCPTTRPLELAYYPDAASVRDAAFILVRNEMPSAPRHPTGVPAEIAAFKGPF